MTHPYASAPWPTAAPWPLFLGASLLALAACGDKDSGGDTGGYASYADEDISEPEEEDTAAVEEDCDEETPVTLYMSPDDSNSMSSPPQVRAAAQQGLDAVLRAPVRVYEWMNYFRWDYGPAEELGDLALHAAMVQDPGGEEGSYLFQFALSSGELSKAERPPLNLALSLDTSGSMSGEPVSLLRTVGLQIAGQLREGDVVSVVEWDTSNNVRLAGHAVTGPDDHTLLTTISQIGTNGGTDLSGGLEAGYSLAEAHHAPGRTSRVVLISDGGANAGLTDEELIGRYAGEADEEGIYLVGVGVGEGPYYNDALMDTVTDMGRGAAVFIDSEAEARRIFDQDFVNTFEVANRSVKVQLDLPPGFEIVRTTAEQVSTVAEEVRDQHLAPNDHMVFHQEIRTCAPEELSRADEVTITATWLDPVTFEGRSTSRTWSMGELWAADDTELRKGRAIATAAAAVQALRAERFEDGPDASSEVSRAKEALAEALALDPDDADLAELAQVVDLL